jgi:tetratricopeptide (TPR) repeat protein
MRINRFSPALLIVVVLCTSQHDRSFAAGNGDANKNVAATATPEEAAMRETAYGARLAARAAVDEGFLLGRTGDFGAAKKKCSQAIELDPGFSPAYRLRAAACLKMRDWTGAIVDLDTLIMLDPNDADIFNERGYARRQLGDLHGARDDFDRCISLGTNLALAYANRAEAEAMLGDEDAAAADLTHARSLAPTMPHAPPPSATPRAQKKQPHHDASGAFRNLKTNIVQ